MSRFDTLRGRYRVEADPVRTERRVELAALVLGLLLCLQLLYSVVRLVLAAGPAAISPAQDALQVGQVQSVAAVDAGRSQEIRARPLFWITRRPVEEKGVEVDPVVEEKKSAGELKGVKLLGVFGSGDTAGIIALAKGKKQRILKGEAMEGWTLESVEPNRVVLVDGGRREELVLMHRKVAAVENPAVVDPPGNNGNGPTVGPGNAASGSGGGGFIPLPGAERGHGLRRSRGAKE